MLRFLWTEQAQLIWSVMACFLRHCLSTSVNVDHEWDHFGIYDTAQGYRFALVDPIAELKGPAPEFRHVDITTLWLLLLLESCTNEMSSIRAVSHFSFCGMWSECEGNAM
jgi:hypothetical protein